MKIRNRRFILTVLVLSFFLLVQFSFAGIPIVYSKSDVVSEQVIDIGLEKVVNTAGPYYVGDRISFTVSVINTGNAAFNANGVKVYDPQMKNGSPDFGDVVASPPGGWNGPNGKWVIGNVVIPPGGSVSLILTGTLLHGGTICNNVYFVFSAQVERDDNPENNTAQVCIDVVERDADIYVYKTCHDITPGATGVLAYTITVGNDGPSDALNFVLTDTLPSGLSNATYAVDGTGQGAWTGSHSFGTMASGASHTVTIYVDVSSSLTSIGSNTASVTSGTADSNTGNNSDTCTNTITTDADIYVYKTCHDITPGDTNVLAYTIGVGNDGPSDAANFVLTDTLPSGLSNATYAVDGTGQGAWTGSHSFGTMASGASHTVTIYVDVSPSLTTIGSNTASVTSGTADSNTGNNSDTCTNTVTYTSSISITKVADITLAAVGDTITYTYTVTNNGNVTLTSITVNDNKLGSITLGVTTLDPGASTTGTATYTVQESDLPGPIVNIAIAEGIDPDENSVTDTASESVTLVQPTSPSISITKVANITLAAIGDTITYTYTVTNTGDTTLSGITVNDNKLGSITLGATTLDPGASTTGTDTYTVQEADLPGPIVNIAIAEGIDPDENSVTDTASASVSLSSPQPLPEEEIVVYHHNFFSGYSDKTFRSENYITRAEVSSSVARALGLKWQEYLFDIFSYSFPDVTDLFWGFGHVEALFGEKLIIGYPDGTFGPNRSITRAEAAQIFFRLLNLQPKYSTTPTFSDMDSSHWAYGAVEAIAEREIILGYPDGTFRPDKPITRAEFVTIACKTLGRGPFEEGIIENPYPDLKSSHWAFSFIMEASIPHIVLNPLRQDFLIVIPSKKIPIYSEWADSTIEVPELGSIIIAIVPVDGLTPEGNDPPPREVIVKIIVKREMP